MKILTSVQFLALSRKTSAWERKVDEAAAEMSDRGLMQIIQLDDGEIVWELTEEGRKRGLPLLQQD